MATPFNVWQGVQSGQQLVDGLFKQQDQMRAGRALAEGNYADAMKALGAGGDVEGVRQIQTDQVASQQRETATADKAKAEQLAMTQRVLRTLQRARQEGQDVGQLVEQYRPLFAQMGTGGEDYNRVAGTIVANPDILDQYVNAIDREVQVINRGNGGYTVLDKGNGEVLRDVNPDRGYQVSGDISYSRNTGQSVEDNRQEDREVLKGAGPNGEDIVVGFDPRTNAANTRFRGAAPRPEYETISPEQAAAQGLPEGWWQRNRNGQITPLAGAESTREQAEQARKEEGRFEALQVKIDSGQTALERAKRLTGWLSTGVASNLIPLNQARENLSGQIETLKSIFSFSELQQMRENSPTGGALGNVSNIELALLGSTIASMNQNMSPKEFRESLEIIDGAFNRWQQAVDEYRQQQGLGQAAPQSSGQPAASQGRRADTQGRSRANVGTQENPIRLNEQSPRQSYNNIRSGQYYRDPNGVIRQKQ